MYVNFCCIYIYFIKITIYFYYNLKLAILKYFYSYLTNYRINENNYNGIGKISKNVFATIAQI